MATGIVDAGTAAASPSEGSASTTSASVSRKIEATLTTLMTNSKAGRTDFWVKFDSRASLSAAAKVQGRADRGRAVVDTLKSTARDAQADATKLLTAQGVHFTSYWITNAIRVHDGTAELARMLASDPRVASVFAPVTYVPVTPVEQQPAGAAGTAATSGVEWGLDNIRAPQVWDNYGVRGDGIVVANIDTGVQFDHPALVNSYRGNNRDGTFSHDYNWLDTSPAKSPFPVDANGHGTHTMGTMVGDDGADNRVGVAPGVTWIAANGCCASDQTLIDSAQWMLAPTKADGTDPRPDLRPDIVNNSWGSQQPSNDPFLEDITTAWAAEGIFGVWANGNIGPGCNSSGTPGSLASNYSVGNYDITNTIAPSSSRGPGQNGEIKPNISAPGTNVRSSIPGGKYANFTGTSMATPHVAGTIALLWSAAPALRGDIAATRAALDNTAVDAPDAQCGGTPGRNNVFGEGRLDALALVAPTQTGQTATATGTITNAETGTPVAGASVIFAPDDPKASRRSVRTDTSGAFRVQVPTGSYTVTASAFGYENASTTATLATGDTVTVELALTALPGYTVTGRLVDDRTGAGIPNATVTLSGTPFSATTTDTGEYTLTQIPGPAKYQVTTAGTGCSFPAATTVRVDGDTAVAPLALRRRADIPIEGRLGTSYGYTCQLEKTQWIEGTNQLQVPQDATIATEVALPFAFTYYGKTYDRLYLNRLGLLTFWPSAMTPSGPQIRYGMEPFADNFYLAPESKILTTVNGTAPNRTFTVEYRDMTFFTDQDARVSAEVTLYEGGDIVYAYQGIDDDSFKERGGGATVGIRSEDPWLPAQYDQIFLYSEDAPALTNDHQIRFTLPPNGKLDGLVVDAKTGAPVAGATVRVTDQHGKRLRRTTTDTNGRYNAQLFTDRTYTVQVLKPGGYPTPAESTARITSNRQTLALTSRLAAGTLTTDKTALSIGRKPGDLTIRNRGSAPLNWSASIQPTPDAAAPTPGTILAGATVDNYLNVAATQVGGAYWVTGMDLSSPSAPFTLIQTTMSGDRIGTPINLSALVPSGALPMAAALEWIEDRGELCIAFASGAVPITCIDPDTGKVRRTIRTPVEPDERIWGLASGTDDTLYVLAENPQIDSTKTTHLYTLTGLGGSLPGKLIGSCWTDQAVGGLAYNPVNDTLWTTATWAAGEGQLQLDPTTCAGSPGISTSLGGGMALGKVTSLGPNGELILHDVFTGIYRMATSEPITAGVPGLTLTPEKATIGVNGKSTISVSVDRAALPADTRTALLVLRGNGGAQTTTTIPITIAEVKAAARNVL